jgi:Tfp pilus assembly protein PilN
MIRINLLPQEERPVRRTYNLQIAPVFLSIGLFLLVAAPIGTTMYRQAATNRMLTESIAEAKSEGARLRPQIERVQRLNRESQELSHRILVVEDLDKANTFYVEMLDDLSRELPRHMWLVRFEEQGTDGARMVGLTFSNLIVADLMVRLEKSGHFTNVELVKIERDSLFGRSVLVFELNVRLVRTGKGVQVEHP